MVVCGFEIGPISDAARRHAGRVHPAHRSCVSVAIPRSALLRIPVSRRDCDQVRTAGWGVRALVGHRLQTGAAFRCDVGAGRRQSEAADAGGRRLVLLSSLPVGYRQGFCNLVSAGNCHAGSRKGA